MLVKKKKLTEESIEVKLPYFSIIDKGYVKEYYSIFEDHSCRIVLVDETTVSVFMGNKTMIVEALDGKEITEEVFQAAFQMAIDKLKKTLAQSSLQSNALAEIKTTQS